MSVPSRLPPIVAFLGPTAVGKSAIAMRLAEKFNGEIVSVDSRQVYRHLDIGTAKPTRGEREAVRHHLLDMVDPDEPFTVVDFFQAAHDSFASIASRGKVALFVGGTGHYARTVLEGTTIPHIQPQAETRRLIEADIARRGGDAVVAEIAQIDPVTASRIDPNNTRRLVRALEVIRVTGKPIPEETRAPIPALILGLQLDRLELYRRIDRRCEVQFESGLVEETKSVLEMGFGAELPPLRGLAYAQAVEFISGRSNRKDALQAYKYATHRLARRQLTWLRTEPRLQWIDAAKESVDLDVVRRIERYLQTVQ